MCECESEHDNYDADHNLLRTQLQLFTNDVSVRTLSMETHINVSFIFNIHNSHTNISNRTRAANSFCASHTVAGEHLRFCVMSLELYSPWHELLHCKGSDAAFVLQTKNCF